MTRVAVTSRSFSRHPVLRAELLARFPATTFNDGGAALHGDGLIAFLRGHDAAITALEKLDDPLFAALPALRVISKYGVGLDMIDLESMRRHAVRLGWTGGVNRRAVAELVIAFAIALLRRLPECRSLLAERAWRQPMGRELSGRTVGIVGCGHVGQEVGRLFRLLGCRLLINDICDRADFCRAHGARPVALDALLAQSDIVTLHLPLDAGTRGLFGAARLKRMRPDAVLINTCRGGIVDEAALAAMLREGRLAGAAFDVFATEPPDESDLLDAPNFIATPHIGGSSEEAILAMGRAAIRGLAENKVPEPGDPCWPLTGPALASG